jgi:DNA-binding NarL/FixJ family response regulator
MIKVAIVDDSDSIREHLTNLLNNTQGFKVVITYFNAVQAIGDIFKHELDIVLMDISMPGLNGIDAVAILKDKMPLTQFMMITVHDDDENIFNALKAGASGYLLKNTSDDKMIESLHDLRNGGSPMSADIARRVVASFRQPSSNANELDILTNREREIVELLCKNYAYKEIAEQLYISRETVKKHIKNIYEKLHVQNKFEVIQKLKSNIKS